jgi:hypothetical protein
MFLSLSIIDSVQSRWAVETVDGLEVTIPDAEIASFMRRAAAAKA